MSKARKNVKFFNLFSNPQYFKNLPRKCSICKTAKEMVQTLIKNYWMTKWCRKILFLWNTYLNFILIQVHPKNTLAVRVPWKYHLKLTKILRIERWNSRKAFLRYLSEWEWKMEQFTLKKIKFTKLYQILYKN